MPEDNLPEEHREPSGVFPTDQFEQWIETQKQELDVKALEIKAREKEDIHAHDYALKALDAEKQDRIDNRKLWFRSRIVLFVFTGSMVELAGLQ